MAKATAKAAASAVGVAAKAPERKGVRQWQALVNCWDKTGPMVRDKKGKLHTGKTRYFKEGERFTAPAPWEPTPGKFDHFIELTPEVLEQERQEAAEAQFAPSAGFTDGDGGMGSDAHEPSRGGHAFGTMREGDEEVTSGSN